MSSRTLLKEKSFKMADDLMNKRKQALLSRFEAERERVAQRYDVQLQSLQRRKDADLQAIERRSESEIARLEKIAVAGEEGRARLN